MKRLMVASRHGWTVETLKGISVRCRIPSPYKTSMAVRFVMEDPRRYESALGAALPIESISLSIRDRSSRSKALVHRKHIYRRRLWMRILPRFSYTRSKYRLQKANMENRKHFQRDLSMVKKSLRQL